MLRLDRVTIYPAVAALIAISQPALAQTTAPAAPPTPMDGMQHPPALPQTIADWARGAQLFDGLGSFHRKVTTTSAEAQGYFDQGMRLLWAFNHDEAARSFARATELDPGCAACYWGVALTLGPNYNMPLMAEPRARVAWDALGKARQLAPRATPVEQALIVAVGKRYAGPTPIDPANGAPLLSAYAAAMGEVAARFPADWDVQTLYAEALMNTNPWKLWNADGTPGPGTPQIVSTLEKVLANDPAHPGANHYYVHAVEASPHPEKALASAERMRAMMPAAGHLVHMPAHIFQRVGRYEGAAEANRKAAAADIAYYARTAAPDYYPMYTAHNYQFLAFSASMQGRKAETIAALRHAREAVPDEMLPGMAGVDWTIGYLYAAMVRFGMWDEILREPAPNPKLTGLSVGYLEAKTFALAMKGRVPEAKAALAQLDAAIASAPADYLAGLNPARRPYRIALLRAQARVAAAEHATDRAIPLLREAVGEEDKLDYNEPADSFFPTRHLLGAVLLETGKPAEAEIVYREDLKRNPANGWSLYGLSQALSAQRRAGEAAATREQFSSAWKNADITLTASAL
jgi:tetratricopeptide (TPR) repeat protein